MQGDLGSLQNVFRAVTFAAKKHARERRKDPERTPYINHPLGLVSILLQHGVSDTDVLQAALLHDTVEDTDTTFEELQQEFGQEVMEIVRECTDDKMLSKADRKRLQVETAPHKSDKVFIFAFMVDEFSCIYRRSWSRWRINCTIFGI